MNHPRIRKQSSSVYPSFINSLLRPRIAQTNWAGTLSAEFQNSLLNKWLMLCFGGYGTMDACNHDQAMLNLPFIKVRAVSGLTLLAALKNSLSTALAGVTCQRESFLYEKRSGFFWIQVMGYVKYILKSRNGNRKHHKSLQTKSYTSTWATYSKNDVYQKQLSSIRSTHDSWK